MIYRQNSIITRLLAFESSPGNGLTKWHFICDTEAMVFRSKNVTIPFCGIQSVTLEHLVPHGHSKRIEDLPSGSRPSSVTYFSPIAEFTYIKRDALKMYYDFLRACNHTFTTRQLVHFHDGSEL